MNLHDRDYSIRCHAPATDLFGHNTITCADHDDDDDDDDSMTMTKADEDYDDVDDRDDDGDNEKCMIQEIPILTYKLPSILPEISCTEEED